MRWILIRVRTSLTAAGGVTTGAGVVTGTAVLFVVKTFTLEDVVSVGSMTTSLAGPTHVATRKAVFSRMDPDAPSIATLLTSQAACTAAPLSRRRAFLVGLRCSKGRVGSRREEGGTHGNGECSKHLPTRAFAFRCQRFSESVKRFIHDAHLLGSGPISGGLQI